MKLGILTSHPIQYEVPWFRALAKEVDTHVFFAHQPTPEEQGKAGFGVSFDWDIDLSTGYAHTFLTNRSRFPGVNHFFGCDTPEIGSYVKKFDFDVFLITGWYLKSHWQAVSSCRRLGIPVLVRGDSQLNPRRFLFRRVGKRLLYKILFRLFDGYLAVGRRSRDYFLHYGARPERIFSVPHVVDNDWFREKSKISEAERQALRQGFNVNGKSKIVLFVGKLIPKKRPLDLLWALRILERRGVDVQTLFVGAGELEKDIRETARKLEVRAHFAGFKNQSELPRYYGISDLLVLPSDGRETWGLVVNEAMACGVPAVVSDAVGCGPDLIIPGKTGLIYTAGKPAKLADAIQAMLAAVSREEVSAALRNKMREYSVEGAVKGLKEAMNEIGICR